MQLKNRIPDPKKATKSTFLVGRALCNDFLFSELMNGLNLADYLHRLLKDPLLEYKLHFIRAEKWKKTYQHKGQDLVRLHFTPDEGDWARISMISNGTGFSRCYIFVYLMLIDKGLILLPLRGTPVKTSRKLDPLELFCSIFLDEKNIKKRKLTRIIQT